VQCPQHGVKQIAIPWAEPGSQFTLLFERLAIDWLRECSVTGAAAGSGGRSDHASLVAVGIPDARRSRIVNSLARDEVLGHPFEFAKAAFQSGVNYLHLAYRSAFEPYKSKVLRLILTFAVVAAIGLVIGRHFRRGQRAILADLALASATVLAIPVLTLAIPVGSGPPGRLAAHQRPQRPPGPGCDRRSRVADTPLCPSSARR